VWVGWYFDYTQQARGSSGGNGQEKTGEGSKNTKKTRLRGNIRVIWGKYVI